jgi:Pentapeptide repeats (8 copies)
MSARRTYTTAELADILAKHRSWRQGDPSGARADLAGANLAGAYLAGADLAGANLAGAYLAGADLAGADLADADLAGADLADADLAGADLAGANLAGAYLADANLAGANLAGAYLADAYLADARNVPAGTEVTDPPEPYVRNPPTATLAARAERYRQRHPEVPVVEALDRRILDAVTVGGGTLDMGSWHSETCQTTHCRAGWAITLAGEAGAALEKQHGPQRAGAMIYRASTGRAPFFFARTDDALEDIKRCAAEQTS